MPVLRTSLFRVNVKLCDSDVSVNLVTGEAYLRYVADPLRSTCDRVVSLFG